MSAATVPRLTSGPDSSAVHRSRTGNIPHQSASPAPHHAPLIDRKTNPCSGRHHRLESEHHPYSRPNPNVLPSRHSARPTRLADSRPALSGSSPPSALSRQDHSISRNRRSARPPVRHHSPLDHYDSGIGLPSFATRAFTGTSVTLLLAGLNSRRPGTTAPIGDPIGERGQNVGKWVNAVRRRPWPRLRRPARRTPPR